MPSRGFWAWVADFKSPKTASGVAEDPSTQINISHRQGRTDSYRPSYHDDLVRNGILPPPRGTGSARIFHSARRTSPTKGRATPANGGSNRVSKHTSKKTSPAASTGRQRPISRPLTNRPETKTRYQVPRKSNGQFAKIRKEEPVSVKPSSPPPKAPKAPLADRLQDMNSLFSNLDVANTPLAAHRAPFKHHISSNQCTHYLCPVGDEPHSEGLYLHEGKFAARPHNYFGASNPPPWLWETYKKVEASEAIEMDFLNLHYFITCHPPHFGLCQEEFWE